MLLFLLDFSVQKTHTTSLSLCIFIIFSIFLFFLSFYCFLSPYLSIILLYLSTNLGLPIYVYLPTSNIPTYLSQTYLPLTTYPYQHNDLPISTDLPTFVFLPTHTNPCQPIIYHLPTYLPVPILKYQYIIATDQCDQMKIAKCLSKLPKNGFSRKMIDFDTLTKIA